MTPSAFFNNLSGGEFPMVAGAIGEAERIVLCRPVPERRIDFFLTFLLAKFTNDLRSGGQSGEKPVFKTKLIDQPLMGK
jgi:hypothetical protein